MTTYTVLTVAHSGRTTTTLMGLIELQNLITNTVRFFTLLPDHWVSLDRNSLTYSREGIITSISWKEV